MDKASPPADKASQLSPYICFFLFLKFFFSCQKIENYLHKQRKKGFFWIYFDILNYLFKNTKLNISSPRLAFYFLGFCDLKQFVNMKSNTDFQEVFAKFDSSNSGLVSTKALGDLLRHMGINPTKVELQVASWLM